MFNHRLPLFGADSFPHPTAHGVSSYVLVIKNFVGEMSALERVPSSAFTRMTPLVEVDMKHQERDDAPRSSRLASLPAKLQLALQNAPFFLDFSGVRPRQKIYVRRSNSRRAVLAVDETIYSCVNQSLNFIPVVYRGMSQRIFDLYKDVVGDGRGACVRVRLERTVLPNQIDAEIAHLVDQLGITPDLTDVILDLGYLPPDPGFGARDLAGRLDAVARIGQWRSLILMGTVIPQFHDRRHFAENQITRVARQEWSLWNDAQKLGISRIPTFGDYGIQHPKSPKPGGSSKSMRPSIRYSTPEFVYVARGQQMSHDGDEQYQRLAAMLANHYAFRKISWGDEEILRYAAGDGEPGKNQQWWREVGTVHHIAEMLQALSSLPDHAPKDANAQPHAPLTGVVVGERSS